MIKYVTYNLLGLFLDHFQDFRLTGVDDGDDGTPEVLSAGCAEIHVITIEWEDVALAQHGVIFDERLVCGRDVACKNDELRFAAAQGLKGLVDAEPVDTGLCHKAEAADDGFTRTGKVLATHVRKADHNRCNRLLCGKRSREMGCE